MAVVNVGLVGAGHIARALARGWSRPGLAGAPALAYFDVSREAAARTVAEAGGTVAGDLAALVAASDVVVVAVRPGDVGAVLAEMGPLVGERPVVSVAAGVTMDRLCAALPHGAKVCRVMPNIAAALGLGVFLFVPGTLGERAAGVEELFALAGDVVHVPEDEFDTATTIAGCMPGILASLVDGFVRAGERRGLDPATATRLTVAGVHGAAAVIATEGDPEAVVAATATPGGMTAAAISALEDASVGAAIDLAVEAATRRARGMT